MNKKNSACCANRELCSKLLQELQVLEFKCDRISVELSDVKKLITSLSPDISSLIDSIANSAKEMHEQSIMHRKHVEQCIGEKSTIRLIRRDEDGI